MFPPTRTEVDAAAPGAGRGLPVQAARSSSRPSWPPTWKLPPTAGATRSSRPGAVSVDPRLGVELGYRGLAFLRGGVGNFQQIDATSAGTKQWKGQYSLGAGVALSGLRVDLALSRLGGGGAGPALRPKPTR
ncbi:MAG: hypothetical protein WKG07_41970 [Hymenobacter sp.]